jgi:hypothetical protein
MLNYTDFGKISRKIAIDTNQTLNKMAMTLGITPSYLGAIQHGVIPLTNNIAKDFVAQYKQFLTKEERKIIIQSARNTSFAKVVFKVNKGCPQHVSNMIGLLESKIDTLSEDAVESISKILEWDSYAEVD